MSALVLVMGLVGLSYLSALLGRRRAVRGLGSGTEWVVVGFLLGPDLLGFIDHAMQVDVEPVLYVAIGWVGLIVGLDYGVVRTRRVGGGRMLLGAALGVLSVLAVGAAAWFLTPFLEPALSSLQRLVLSLGLGAVASETTSNAVHWMKERHGASGPLAELLDDLAEAKDIAPILVAGVALCLHPRFHIVQHAWLSLAAIPASVIVVGGLLGLVAAIMLSREERTDQSWGIVLGITLLAAGTAARLRLPVVTALFALGLALALASRHRARLLLMLNPTKGSALLPAMLLAGARISPRLFVAHGLIAAAILVVRALVLYLSGRLIAPPGRARAAAPILGWAMMPAGALTMTIALSFALTFPDVVGEAVLLTAAVITVIGELIGPLALRAALRRAGELEPSVAIVVSPPPVSA
jgi:hypothetical protein